MSSSKPWPKSIAFLERFIPLEKSGDKAFATNFGSIEGQQDSVVVDLNVLNIVQESYGIFDGIVGWIH